MVVFFFVWANTALANDVGGILFAVGRDICWIDEEDGVCRFGSSSLSLVQTIKFFAGAYVPLFGIFWLFEELAVVKFVDRYEVHYRVYCCEWIKVGFRLYLCKSCI